MASIRSLIAFISSLIASIIAFISSLIPFFTSSSSSFSSSPPPSPSSSSPPPPPPSSSSSSIPYDVFLSFRGEDTRYNFTDHLCSALVNRGIRTFRDDKLSRGEEIAPELLKVIEGSRFSIVVFSENYADSKWCLNELVKIMECREKMGQIVLSIFYHVDPSHVRKQTGSFGKAFNNYKKEKKEMVQRWRTALTEAANLSGWHLSDGYESIHIKKIVEDIFSRLDHPFIHVDKNLVGLDSQLQELTLRLCMGSAEVRMVGIYGCGGIGKTTLAKVVCNRIFHLYEGAIFLANVREVSASPAGLVKLQKQLLNDLVGEKHNIRDVDQGIIMIQNTLSFKRVLVILDDIDNQRQLESLVGRKEWFGPGSRIIITTRNKQLLKVHHPVDESYHMKELDVVDAIELFSWKAFRQNHPKQDYMCLSKSIVDYAKGLPLALEILGSSLYGKTILEWESELDKLKSVLKVEILVVLKISYDGLDRSQKDLFLDLACFFKGQNRYSVSRILDGCKFYASSGIGHLCDRSLITIFDDKIHMHDLIQQMGWEIVRENFPGDPNKWSRLWEPEDIYQAFLRNQEMANVEALFMDLSRLDEIQFNSKAWAEMKKLRLLQIIFSDKKFMEKKSKVHFPEDFEFPSYNLSYLCWEGCPLSSLPSSFIGENLVEIKFSDSNIRQLWPGNMFLGKLKILNLEGSEQLSQISKFSTMPNLEYLDLTLCESLEKIDSSIGVLKKLSQLSLCNCKQLRSLPSSIQYLDSLEDLDLRLCSSLEKFPEMERGCMKGLRRLYLDCSGIKELPSSIGHLIALEYLSVSECKSLRRLPSSIQNLDSLRDLTLSGCSDLEEFPEMERGCMKGLRGLFLGNTAIKELPSSICHLTALEVLRVHKSKGLRSLPSSIRNLDSITEVYLNDCPNLGKFPEMERGCMKGLTELSLLNTAIKELPSSIVHLTALEKLYVENCKNLRSLPTNIWRLKTLQDLSFRDCSNLETFPEIMEDMPEVRSLDLSGTAIKEPPSSVDRMNHLNVLKLEKCKNLVNLPDSISNLEFLRELIVNGCPKLEKFPENLRNLKGFSLEKLDLCQCNGLSDINRQFDKFRVGRSSYCKVTGEIPNLPPALKTFFNPSTQLSSSVPKSLKASVSEFFEASLLELLKKATQEPESYNAVIGIGGIPGCSGIPLWVSNQKMGNQIRIELPMNLCEDNNFLGFAFCIFYHKVDDNKSRSRLGLDYCLKLLGDSGETTDYTPSFPSPGRYVESYGDLFWMEYFPKTSVLRNYHSNQCRHLEIFKPSITSCGVHLIYIQDPQQNHTPELLDFQGN